MSDTKFLNRLFSEEKYELIKGSQMISVELLMNASKIATKENYNVREISIESINEFYATESVSGTNTLAHQ